MNLGTPKMGTLERDIKNSYIKYCNIEINIIDESIKKMIGNWKKLICGYVPSKITSFAAINSAQENT